MFLIAAASVVMLTFAQAPPVFGIPDLSTHKDVKAEVEIKASPDTVWRILTNFPAYDIWNPYIYPAVGQAVAGRQLELTLRGRSVIHYQATVITVKPNRELSWGENVAMGAVQRQVTFDIQPLAAHRVHLVAVERFRGILLPLASGVTADSVAGLRGMTQALRDRAELLEYTPPRSVAPHR